MWNMCISECVSVWCALPWTWGDQPCQITNSCMYKSWFTQYIQTQSVGFPNDRQLTCWTKIIHVSGEFWLSCVAECNVLEATPNPKSPFPNTTYSHLNWFERPLHTLSSMVLLRPMGQNLWAQIYPTLINISLRTSLLFYSLLARQFPDGKDLHFNILATKRVLQSNRK